MIKRAIYKEPPIEPTNPFIVRTPTVHVGVRGTEFILQHDPRTNISSVYLTEGELVIWSNFVEESLSLSPGQKITADKKGLGEVQHLSQAEWDNLNEELGFNSIDDETLTAPESTSDSKETLTLISEDGGESVGMGLTLIIIALLSLVVVALIVFKKMRK